MNGLCATDLEVMLGSTAALRGATLQVPPGWTAIVGPNGAGKSTLLRALAGLQAPSAGQVTLDGAPLGTITARERARRIAWLAQQGEASGGLSVRDVVRLGRLPSFGLFGAPSAADDACVEDALRETESLPWAARRLDELSGGERQRVLLARALAVGARWLLLDEPTTHLDPPHQVSLVRLLRQRALGGTVVVSVLHDLSLALLADTVVVMHQGRVVAAAHPSTALLHQTLHEVFEGAVRIEELSGRWIAVPVV